VHCKPLTPDDWTLAAWGSVLGPRPSRQQRSRTPLYSLQRSSVHEEPARETPGEPGNPEESRTIGEATRLLGEMAREVPGAADAFYRLIYPELRRIAGRFMVGERREHTLQPTALVAEAFLRLAKEADGAENRSEFLAHAGNTMRQALVDHARRLKTRKRGGDRIRVELPVEAGGESPRMLDLLIVDEALTDLEGRDPPAARVALLRFFAGLTLEEIAGVQAQTRRQVDRIWLRAHSYLSGRLA
jgi:RNA polymerase sigma-70 factor (ECF subfamily)